MEYGILVVFLMLTHGAFPSSSQTSEGEGEIVENDRLLFAHVVSKTMYTIITEFLNDCKKEIKVNGYNFV